MGWTVRRDCPDSFASDGFLHFVSCLALRVLIVKGALHMILYLNRTLLSSSGLAPPRTAKSAVMEGYSLCLD